MMTTPRARPGRRAVALAGLLLVLACSGSTAAPAVTTAPERCGNGLDDDGNGKIDCADPACRDEDACTRCGDGAATGTEECDGADLRGRSCASLGWNSGALGCLAVCVLDVRGCRNVEICNNGIDDDGDGDKDCDDSDCRDTDACAVCGDGRISGSEECEDGNTVGGDCCSATCRIEPGCEREPDDTRGTAVPLALEGGGAVTRLGRIAPSGDADLWTFTVPAGSTGTLTAETGPFENGGSCSPGVDTLLEILDGEGTLLASDDDSGEGTCSRLVVAGLAPGPIYVRVSASPYRPTATFAYRIDLALALARCGDGVLQPGQECDDGNDRDGDGCSSACRLEAVAEREPNDDQASAGGPLRVPFAAVGAVGAPQADGLDSDWFAIDVPAAGGIRVEVLVTDAPDCSRLLLEHTLYREDGGELATATRAGSDPRSCTRSDLPDLAAGRYFIKVAGRPSPATYRLVVTAL